MDSSEVGVLKERYEVRFRGFLESHHCRGLEAEIRLRRRISTRCQILEEEVTNLEVLRDFTDKTLEGELADEELRRLLVPTDLAECDGTRPEAMRLLHTASCSLSRVMGKLVVCAKCVESEWKCGLQQRSCAPGTWQRAACGAPCHRWTCERSA